MKTWGGDSWQTGGGGGWMPGGYDAETNTVWWGTANPAPLYDWAGADWKTKGPRPGDNLYTTSVIALDPDTGKLKFYHQELPHDAWDFDSAVGEFVMIERGGKKHVVHPNKGGFVFVYDRADAKVENVWRLVKNINFVKGHRSQDGRADRPPRHGARQAHRTCARPSPAASAGTPAPTIRRPACTTRSARSGAWTSRSMKTTPILEPMAQLNIGANFTLRNPEGGKAHGHVSGARPDHRREEVGSEVHRAAAGEPAVDRRQPGVRAGRARLAARVRRRDRQGALVAQQWRSGTTAASSATRPRASSTSPWRPAGDRWSVTSYGALFGEPFKSMPKDAGALVVFALE